MRVPLGMPSDSCWAARSAAAEISSCSLAVRCGAVERAVVQPASRAAHSKAAETTAVRRISHSLNEPLAWKNSIYPSNYCRMISVSGSANNAREPDVSVIRFLIRKKPRQIADEACSIFVSDIKPDSEYGLSPIVPFQLWAAVRVFNPGLGSASGEARQPFRWS